jgi:hypothetical protein
MAKPLANGVPIGAVMMRDNVAKKIAIGQLSNLIFFAWIGSSDGPFVLFFILVQTGDHGTTFG